MNQISGQIVASHINSIEKAREIARNNDGTETIIKEKDGSFSVFRLDAKDEENILRLADKKLDQNAVSKSLQNLGYASSVIEIITDGEEEGESLTLRNESEIDEKSLSDVPEADTKIDDKYINTANGNSFDDMDDAIKEANMHEGLKAIIENPEGHFMILRISQEKADKIMKDPNYSGKICKILIPYDSNKNIPNYSIDTKSANKLTEYNNIKGNIKDKLSEESIQLISDNSQKKEELEKLESQKANELKNNVQQLKTLFKDGNISSGIEQLDKILESGEIKESDYALLSMVYDGVKSQIESGDLKVSASLKNKIMEFGKIMDKLKVARENVEKVRNEYNTELGSVTQDTLALSKEVKKMRHNNPNNKLLAGLDNMGDEYAKVLATKNKENIALYGAYVKRVYEYIMNGGNDPKVLKEIEDNYNIAASCLREYKKSGSLPPSYEDSFFKSLNFLTSKSGSNQENNEVQAFKLFFKHKPESNTELENTLNNSEKNINKPESNKDSYLPTANNFSGDIKISKDDFEPVRKNESLCKAANQLTKSQDSLSKDHLKINVAIDEVRNIEHEAVKYLHENPEIFVPFKDYLEKQREQMFANKNTEKYADDTLKEIIQNADKLQDKLDLSIDPGKADITDLLRAFRKIIVDLDIDTREIIAKKLTSQMIDKSFANYIKESNDKEKKHSSERDVLNNILSSSREVKDSSLPYEIKKLNQEDVSRKIALVALNNF